MPYALTQGILSTCVRNNTECKEMVKNGAQEICMTATSLFVVTARIF